MMTGLGWARVYSTVHRAVSSDMWAVCTDLQIRGRCPGNNRGWVCGVFQSHVFGFG